MILTCPACTMRYIVSEGAVGSTGRRVRCANCGNQWFQEPEQNLDEALFSEDTPFEAPFPEIPVQDDEASDFQSILRKEIEAAPIPDGVKPQQDAEHDPVLAEIQRANAAKKEKAAGKRGDALAGYATAAAIVIIVFAAFLMASQSVSRIWPASAMIYSMFGLPVTLPGEGLSLASLEAEIKDGKIVMRGTINNLKSTDMDVPPVMATVTDLNGKAMQDILIAPPVSRLKGEGSAQFSASYPKIPDGAVSVNFAFSALSAVAPAGGEGNTEKEKTEAGKTAAPEEGHAADATQNHH
ncbi:MAG: hypothetical protein DI626_00705 [Micavibrio aeruginosavorus]|uniref:Zinc finger/thioredoxin putative domain-containing protein n=1 Tax=Micavibrio aeruginosavorus TaxID=349221 RepID=A0A2W5A6Q6_9BACT|nr:MAG: hypothetical protein DI626_00705 [Micavibrio aeruginosavorus]